MLKILKYIGYVVLGILSLILIVDLWYFDYQQFFVRLIILGIITAALTDIEEIVESVINLFKAIK